MNKKLLTRIQLINWHYFQNERISLNGSTLISGENTAGKSTILDAIQLVLTTNTKKFNMAANEKGNRDLKGYVRCKVGNVDQTYLRKNNVIAQVALEFYEDKYDRYFVIGVIMNSFDEESRVETSWYIEDARLEDFNFIVDQRPATKKEFMNKGKKIKYIEKMSEAKLRIQRRLGNLEDKFFDMIPKSLAFKPMDNVKDFINKFILPKAQIDMESLKSNIERLNELEILLKTTKKQYDLLQIILNKYDLIEKKDFDIKVNDILILLANLDANDHHMKQIKQKKITKQQDITFYEKEQNNLQKRINKVQETLIEVNVAIQSNSSNQRLEKIKQRIKELKDEQNKCEYETKMFKQQINYLKSLNKALLNIDIELFKHNLDILYNQNELIQSSDYLQVLDSFYKNENIKISQEHMKLKLEEDSIQEALKENNLKLNELKKRKLSYPKNTIELKEAIEVEFSKRHIDSQVHILASLLEINDETWSNAVEGYLNKQKFYLIVDAKYYDIALQVYDRKCKQIHSVGLINTKKIPLNKEVDKKSLAHVVISDNVYAKAYVNYILGRVMRVHNVKELEQYDIAITKKGMLYQNYVVRMLNPKTYENPYIGQKAYLKQMENVNKQITLLNNQKQEVRKQIALYDEVLESKELFDYTLFKLYFKAPRYLKENEKLLKKEQLELKEASNDPTLLELQMKLDQIEAEAKTLNLKSQEMIHLISLSESQIDILNNQLKEIQTNYDQVKANLANMKDHEVLAYDEGYRKYQLNLKTKEPQMIANNYAPKSKQYENEKMTLLDQMKQIQYQYNGEFHQDYAIGTSEIDSYRAEAKKIEAVVMIKYEDDLRKTKEDCEIIFKTDFLSKMKEHIENAKREFKLLNSALKDIYYGEDSYCFKMTFNKRKEGLYRMITSREYESGFDLFSQDFNEQYKNEMDDLFDKLMSNNDDKKIIDEYSDYRSYLDYDIEIIKRNGNTQLFSSIYGEKSGSETQVPYYVALAASFYQLYAGENSTRIMLLDEAFDKMDDERITSMMEFFNQLELQVIMATPPAKIEVIGEKVSTILTAIRVGQSSIVEEYDL